MALIQNLNTVCIAPQQSALFISLCLYYYWPHIQEVLKSDTGYNDIRAASDISKKVFLQNNGHSPLPIQTLF